MRFFSFDFLNSYVLAGVVPELAGGHVEREVDVLAGLIPCLHDGFEDDVERFAVRGETGGEAPFVADAGAVPLLLQDAAQRVKDFRAGAHGVGERRRADGHHHELLKVDAAVRVRSAIEDIHHWHRQRHRVAAVERRDVLIKRYAVGGG